jgi:hypothetical protein
MKHSIFAEDIQANLAYLVNQKHQLIKQKLEPTYNIARDVIRLVKH